MKRLAPDLFDRRFDDLVEAGRSRLPSLAPSWTDYNAHDPGITLMELLAFVAEAQMYSLARMRRDERAGYEALAGLAKVGPLPASGSLWPDRSDPASPFLSYQQPVVIEPDAVVRTVEGDTPSFHPTHRILWTAGGITKLEARLADGQRVDLTQDNGQGERPFEPFGALAGAGDVLRLEYRTHGERGLFPKRRESAAQAFWPIGVRVAPALRAVDAQAAAPAVRLAVEMRVGGARIDLPVKADGTRGFMQSGVLLLDMSAVPDATSTLALEIRARGGFARAPRVLAIEPGVLPIVQGGTVQAEPHTATGTPDQRIELDVPGLRFGGDAPAITVRVREAGEEREWRAVDDLSGSGPDDLAYRLDVDDGALWLGNGVNGHLPVRESEIAIDYPHCAGSAGNAPRGRRWTVLGIAGAFGINLEPVAGGRDAQTDIDLRRMAREQLAGRHALVTAQDLVDAARGLGDLEVARAEVHLAAPHADGVRELTLVAMRARSGADEPQVAPETDRWTNALRRALVGRMPLGVRLRVRAPGYRSFAVRAHIEGQPRRNPADIEAAIRAQLRDAFALTPRAGLAARRLGAPVSLPDLAANIRRTAGVRRVLALQLIVGGQAVRVLELGPLELPRLDLAASRFDIERAGEAS
jgi:predicted phage baseplate assembly protein